ncbi:cerato-platanin-related secreted protein [Suillus paluster]|uniref:cerato-platanin-related secreted protein n=1 Tax=Suillus paluster TaxID=48578 RepID=UPI001B8697FE|nr:cerato-platanin-related secreted protein [Suillus paluster]KAG1736893.1 cerato-platanin-related secreted protein [Suillus paluster]
MKFLTASTAIALATCAVATTFTASYDTTYDAGSTSLNTVACSDGPNGLETRGYTTFGSIPSFPYIGGAPQITGWNSPYCGSCWEITYGTTTIHMTAIDVGDAAREGFNLSEEAMNALTGGQAASLGRVSVTATQVAASVCGL